MSIHRFIWVAVLLVGPAAALGQLADPIPGPIPASAVQIDLTPIASGLVAPHHLTTAGDGTDRLFVVDQVGQVHLIKNGALQASPLLDIAPGGRDAGASDERAIVALNNGYDERGLLGLAFHPDFANPVADGYRKFYTYSSEPVGDAADFTLSVSSGFTFNHQSVIAEWQVDAANPDVVDASTRRVLMRIDEPQSNHNAGALAFGADGYLYGSLGDGGAGDDQGEGHGTGNGQNIETIHGSIIRIDPLGNNSANGQYGVPATNPFVGVTGVDEIFAYGLRNPFRFTFDSATGHLFVGDAGQNDIEEISRIDPATDAGANFGWNIKEGTFLFDPNGTDPGFVSADSPGSPAGLVDPIFQYDHDEGSVVLGGYVYHGSAIPELDGKYIFGEFSTTFGAPGAGRLFAGDLTTGTFEELTIDENFFLHGFGQDADGEIYVLANMVLGPNPAFQTGQVYRLEAVPEPATIGLLAAGVGGLMLRRRRRRG